jgi:hypothetical protein
VNSAKVPFHAHLERRLTSVRRVFLPTRATESFTVIGPDLNPVELVDELPGVAD